MNQNPKKIPPRCAWPGNDELMIRYHDQEWGVPVHADRKLFEFLVLDAAQAGLSWCTVLHKRTGYRDAFARFDYRRVAKFTSRDMDRLLRNPKIIRNRQKIQSAITNAKALMVVQEEFGTFAAYVWSFVDHQPIVHRWPANNAIPSISKESNALSLNMKSRGFSFCGSTICYAFMQAAGLVNDHITSCYRHRELR